jgi:UDP-N-acetylglucosamine enolpyruvyl transferase
VVRGEKPLTGANVQHPISASASLIVAGLGRYGALIDGVSPGPRYHRIEEKLRVLSAHRAHSMK